MVNITFGDKGLRPLTKEKQKDKIILVTINSFKAVINPQKI